MARGRGAENAKKRIDYVHKKASEHQRGERESPASVNICLDSAEMVDPD